MKHFCIALVVVVAVLLSGQVYGASTGSTRTSDGAFATGWGILDTLIAIADGTNACSCVLYDNTSAAGTELPHAYVSAGDRMGGYANIHYPYKTGIYLDITGTNCKCYCVFRANE